MTDTITITPGTRIGAWQVLSVDPLGKRAVVVGCGCRTPHIFSCEVLRDGTAMCHAAPLTAAQRELMRNEAEADKRRRRLDLKRWRPEGR